MSVDTGKLQGPTTPSHADDVRPSLSRMQMLGWAVGSHGTSVMVGAITFYLLFYMTDSLDPEYIHNAARNMEKASWMLANRKDARGQPWLLSNEISAQGNNLSYAVEFGKIIARLDLLTDVLDESTRRIGVGYAQSLLFMNFLPVQSVDPFTGVIVTGYGTPPGGGRAYRATVYIKDPALDARSLNVALQTRGGPIAIHWPS